MKKLFLIFGFCGLILFQIACKKGQNSSNSKDEGWKVGDVVEVEWNGSWYKANILEAVDGKYKVHYEGYDASTDEVVGNERIRKIGENSNQTGNSQSETPSQSVNLEPGKMPFDFPIIEKTDAQPGENVFYINMKLIQNDLAAGKNKFSTQFLLGKLKESGDKESIVDFVGDNKVPNSGIIRIPKNESVKVGDILAAKWAVNMTRAIVVDANPSAPKAIMIGLSYDNPAKADDNTTPIGQFAYTLKQGEFINITNKGEFAPSSCCAVKKDGSWRLMEVFRAEGDKVMGIIFTEFTAVPKSDCIPIPLKPDFKEGDTVMAPWVGAFAKGKVTKIDNKNGRITVKFEQSYQGEKVLAFGEVIKSLPE